MRHLLFQVYIGGCEVLAVQISYTGELGWELYMHKPGARAVYKELIEKGTYVSAEH